jgi:hypothetical protein
MRLEVLGAGGQGRLTLPDRSVRRYPRLEHFSDSLPCVERALTAHRDAGASCHSLLADMTFSVDLMARSWRHITYRSRSPGSSAYIVFSKCC